MDKKIKVILPISDYLLHTQERRNNNDNSQSYENHMIPVETALNILMTHGLEYMFSDMILHNISLSNIMRTLGATALVRELCSIVTPNEVLEHEGNKFVQRWEGKKLGNIDIQVLPTTSTFTLNGITFSGLQELKDSVVRSYRPSVITPSASIEIEPRIQPQCFVGKYWERYPAFDIYDLADGRTYQNYVIRKNPISDDEFKAISELGRFNYCAITEETPAKLLPLVYYEGEGGYMLVADRHIHG